MIFNAITKDMKINIVIRRFCSVGPCNMFHAVVPDCTESHPKLLQYLRLPPSESQNPETNPP